MAPRKTSSVGKSPARSGRSRLQRGRTSVSLSPSSQAGSVAASRDAYSLSPSLTATTCTQPGVFVGRQRVALEPAVYSPTTGRRTTSVVGEVVNAPTTADDVSLVSMKGADDSWFLSAKKGAAEDGKKYALNKYVRQTLFPRWNFFTTSTQLLWSNNTTSIPQFS